MFDSLKGAEGGIDLIFKVDSTAIGNATYLNDTITFRSNDDIKYETFSEEMIHAVQDNCVYTKSGEMNASRKQIEYEAKVLRDLVSFNFEVDSGYHWVGSVGSNPQKDKLYEKDYEQWVQSVAKGKEPVGERFNEFCGRWTNDAYDNTPSTATFQSKTI